MLSLKKRMHFKQCFPHFLPKRFRKLHNGSPVRLSVVKRTFENGTAKHFLKAHCLRAKLERITGILPEYAALLFNRVVEPKPLLPAKRNSAVGAAEFHYIALP